MSLLAKEGADPDQAAFDGTTPFYHACRNADIAMDGALVRLLHGLGVELLTHRVALLQKTNRELLAMQVSPSCISSQKHKNHI